MRSFFSAFACAACISFLAAPSQSQTPCTDSLSAECVVSAVYDLFEENTNWNDPATLSNSMRPYLVLAVSLFLSGEEEMARGVIAHLLAHLKPSHLETEYRNLSRPSWTEFPGYILFLNKLPSSYHEEFLRMIGVTTDDANSDIDRVDDGPSDKHQAFSELTNDTDLTPEDLVAKARDIWPESNDDGVELRVFRHLVYDDGNLAEAARFLDAYPNLESELLRQLPAMQFGPTETMPDCLGIDCIGLISREWSGSRHRQSVCDHVTAEVQALVKAGIEDETALMGLALYSVWAAEFCDPSTVRRMIAFAEPLVLLVPAGDEWGMGRVILAGYLSIASHIIGDDEIGARIFSPWMDYERHDVERLVFAAVSLERLGHRHRAKALLWQAWEIAAPYAARSKFGSRNFHSLKMALAEHAMVAAIFGLLEEQDAGD